MLYLKLQEKNHHISNRLCMHQLDLKKISISKTLLISSFFFEITQYNAEVIDNSSPPI